LFARQQFVIRILYYIYYVFRYGAFVFGNNRSFIPKDFGKKSPPLFRKVAVKNAAQVRVFYFKFPIIYFVTTVTPLYKAIPSAMKYLPYKTHCLI
jgi:hypothetical protein